MPEKDSRKLGARAIRKSNSPTSYWCMRFRIWIRDICLYKIHFVWLRDIYRVWRSPPTTGVGNCFEPFKRHFPGTEKVLVEPQRMRSGFQTTQKVKMVTRSQSIRQVWAFQTTVSFSPRCVWFQSGINREREMDRCFIPAYEFRKLGHKDC
jgi:hypothetical protein